MQIEASAEIQILKHAFSCGTCCFGLPLWLRSYRICLQDRRPGSSPWVGKIPWRREWPPTPLFLPGEFHGQRSLAGCNPQGRKELDITERLIHTHTHTHTRAHANIVTYLEVSKVCVLYCLGFLGNPWCQCQQPFLGSCRGLEFQIEN